MRPVSRIVVPVALKAQRAPAVRVGRGEAPRIPGGVAMTKCRVLIVDDEPALLSAAWGMLGETYSLFTATNAEAALQILERERIGVIVSDYQMPGMNGLALLIEVKRRFPRVVRVLMTAYADMDLVVRALNEGEIQRFIAKPCRAGIFTRILAECREMARAAEDRSDAPRGRTVLVGHDSPTLQASIRHLLSPEFDVLTTGNGVEVMTWLATKRVDALVLGVGLELLDGCTIATYLKQVRKLALPLAVLSSNVAGAFGEYLEECGADLVLDPDSPDSFPRLQKFLARLLA